MESLYCFANQRKPPLIVNSYETKREKKGKRKKGDEGGGDEKTRGDEVLINVGSLINGMDVLSGWEPVRPRYIVATESKKREKAKGK